MNGRDDLFCLYLGNLSAGLSFRYNSATKVKEFHARTDGYGTFTGAQWSTRTSGGRDLQRTPGRCYDYSDVGVRGNGGSDRDGAYMVVSPLQMLTDEIR